MGVMPYRLSEKQYEIRPAQLHSLISGNIKIIENRFQKLGVGGGDNAL